MDGTGRAVQRSGGGLLGRLLPPVLAAREYHGRLAVWNAALALVIAVVGVVLVADAPRLVFVLVFAAGFGLRGARHAWRFRRVSRAARAVPLPPAP